MHAFHGTTLSVIVPGLIGASRHGSPAPGGLDLDQAQPSNGVGSGAGRSKLKSYLSPKISTASSKWKTNGFTFRYFFFLVSNTPTLLPPTAGSRRVVVDNVEQQQEARDQTLSCLATWGTFTNSPTAVVERKERSAPDGYRQRGTARFTAYRRDMHAAAATGVLGGRASEPLKFGLRKMIAENASLRVGISDRADLLRLS